MGGEDGPLSFGEAGLPAEAGDIPVGDLPLKRRSPGRGAEQFENVADQIERLVEFDIRGECHGQPAVG